MVKFGLRSLVASAAAVLILLTLLSDLTPEKVGGFNEAKVGSGVSVDCVVVQCNQTRSGIIITAMDSNDDVVSMFLSPSVLAAPVPSGSVIRVVLTPSDDDPTFMFASSIELLS